MPFQRHRDIIGKIGVENKARFTIFLTVFIDLVGFGIVIPLHPYLAREFGADPLQVGLLMAIYSALQFLFSPFWGRLSDRLGRRPVLLVSLLGSTLAHLAFGLGTELWVLFAARGGAGLFAANISTAMAYMADISTHKERSKSMALIGVAFGLGFTIGPFLGGILIYIGQSFGDAAPYGSHFAAVIASLICFINFLMTYFFLPESRRSRGVRPKRSRLGLLMGQLKRKTVGALMFSLFFYSLAMANMEIPLFLYVQDRLGWPAETASYGFAYLGFILVLTQGYFVRKWLPKWGERQVLILGLILGGLGFGMIAGSHHLWMLTVAVTLMGFGIGLVGPSISGCVSLLTHEDGQGETLGANQSLSALGRVIGPTLGGWLYKEAGSEAPFAFAAFLMGIALLVVFSQFKKIPNSAVEP